MVEIFTPDDTLPSFAYLDQLSEIEEADIVKAVKQWNKKHGETDLKNIAFGSAVFE